MNNPDHYDVLGMALAAGVVAAALWLFLGNRFEDMAHAVSLFARL